MGAGVFVVSRGVGAIERVAKVLMPALLVLVVGLAIRAATLPGASDGMAFLFGVDWGELKNAEIWLQALTQNAWDTGAGWGLVLCYAAYLRTDEETAPNSVVPPTPNTATSASRTGQTPRPPEPPSYRRTRNSDDIGDFMTRRTLNSLGMIDALPEHMHYEEPER